jgi:Amt family ammonium transporter
MLNIYRRWLLAALLVLGLAVPSVALAQEEAPPPAVPDGGEVKMLYAGTDDDGAAVFIDPGTFVVNNLWILIAAALVFVMHLGFATLESGLCRSKNAVNILTKNVAIICIGLLTYWFMGFNFMYPGENWLLKIGDYGVIPAFAFLLNPDENGQTVLYAKGAYTFYSDFIFQAMFAATAATIVSGAVAERIKLGPFLIFSTLFVMLAYTLTGAWKWGGGWLDAMGFYDFAGSTVVHAVGGFAALAGVIILGPRLGKYGADGSVRPIPGHSLPLATIGVFMLFLGWFGFNGGSVLSADPDGVSYVFTTTALAAAAGGMAALFVSWMVGGKPDLSMALNGILAGLVGITAGADVVGINASVFIGLIAGAIVVLSVIGLDRLKLDDPVGAISVHGVCGIWGTLAVGIFGISEKLDGAGGLGIQLLGTFAIGLTAFVIAMVLFVILKATIGIRVSESEELEGLDIGEHGMEAYPDFPSSTVGSTASSGALSGAGRPVTV